MNAPANNHNSARFDLTVFHFLIEKRGYSQSVLAIHQAVDGHLQPDVTVIDTERERILAFVEIKEIVDNDQMQSVAQRYSSYLQRARLAVPVYLFSKAVGDSKSLRIFSLAGSKDWEPISEEQFPEYRSLLGSRAAHQTVELKQERTEAIDDLKLRSNQFAAFFLFLFVIPFWTGVSYSTEQMILLGAAFGAMALPYYPTIKLAKLELIRDVNHNTAARNGAGEEN